MRAVYTTKVAKVKSEDSGKALIAELYPVIESATDNCMFVRLQSWDETGTHAQLNFLVNKRIKITVETLE